jgi:predicted TIM-barrel fold metal-dependent hydrolase
LTKNDGISRRSLLQTCAAAAGAAASAALLSSRSQGATEANFPPGKFVDMHTHLGQTWTHTKPLSAKALLEWMDEHEVSQSIVLPLVSPESSSYLLTVDFVLEETKPHRDRLIPFCCIDPRTSYTGGPTGLKTMLQRYVDRGCKGFGEHKPGVAVDDKRSSLLYAFCGDLKLPVLFHLEAGKEPRNTDRPGLPGLEQMLKDHPNTTFIGHGPGWWASISGEVSEDLAGYPNKPVAPGGAIDRLMDKYHNIYGDLSAGSGSNALTRDLAFARDFITRRQDRLMFGTDYLSPGQPVPQFELFNKKLELPAGVQAKVFRNNARRLLGLL